MTSLFPKRPGGAGPWSAFVALALAVLALPARGFPIFESPHVVAWEYVNEVTGHHVLLTDEHEMSLVDSGRAGTGWRRTNFTFTAYKPGHGGTRAQACRFYAPSPNSHFFTADATECQALRQPGTGWLFEGVRFQVDLPVGGACPGSTVPIYRLYNNRWMFDDSAHRLTPDAAVRAELAAAGWRDEGIAFCALSWKVAPVKSFVLEAKDFRTVAECEDERVNQGGCVGLNQVPAPVHRIPPYLPPWYVTDNPQYSDIYTSLTGMHFDVLTAQSPLDVTAVAAHSFVQASQYRTRQWGIRVSGLDRGASAFAGVEPIYQLATEAPAAGSPDARVFPWRGGRHQWMELGFWLTAQTAKPVNPQAHAYGVPIVQFRDASSGRALYVTLQTFGTVPPGDFMGRDAASGAVIVSTAFGPSAAFGTTLAGAFIACSASGCAAAGRGEFKFRIERHDFEAILRAARALEPALSPSAEDYLLANFRFRAEIYGDADLGLTLSDYAVDLFWY